MKHKITFLPDNVTIDVEHGTSLFKATKAAGVYVLSSCGGKGNCGKCKVVVKSGAVEPGKSASYLTKEEAERGYALACHSHVESDLVVEIPPESRMQAKHKIATGANTDALIKLMREAGGCLDSRMMRVYMELKAPTLDDNISDFERIRRALDDRGFDADHMHMNHVILKKLAHVLREANWKITLSLFSTGDVTEVLDIYGGDTTKKRFGAAVDIGTTTIVVYLVDMKNGQIVGTASSYNAQVKCGDDVITRIVYATEKNGLQELQDLAVGNITAMLTELANKNAISPTMIDYIVVAGNTTMNHLFYGINPQFIREEPYIPTAAFLPLIRGKNVGLGIDPQAVVYAMPNVASYVGGDITAGVLVSQMHKQDQVSLFIDVGTNGEMVLGNREWLVTAACSAGPAFEGSGIKFGMRAMEGAIEEVEINPRTFEVNYRVIGDTKPIGICGSGMIDALAEMYLTGVIDQKGKIREEIKSKRIRRGESGLEYVLAWRVESSINKEIVLTEVDLDNLIRAKAAIYAGFATLLGHMGMGFGDVDKIFIAGGFGRYIDVERAVTIGMLPDLPVEKFQFLGNTSIMGAYYALLCDRLRHEAEDIARKMTYVELSVSRNFMDEYMSALFLPHTNLDAFPTVKKEMTRAKTWYPHEE
ncbi:MAG: ASKHA domain-containing protein [Nitrospiraceae bacterium]|nr:ASKHA domain-containing protein [Nitrospiraceae bacterium]